MSAISELDDTASLRRNLNAPLKPLPSGLDDTDRLPPWDTETGPPHGKGKAHEYAEGIIRFYRARTILDGNREIRDSLRAWGYLEPLSPHDLPASARWHFLDLVYFMRQSGSEAFDEQEFSERVRTIAKLIDNVVDRLNFELDRAHR